jgi:hypothetical protein
MAAINRARAMTLLMCIAESLSMIGFACYDTASVLMKAWGLNNSKRV